LTPALAVYRQEQGGEVDIDAPMRPSFDDVDGLREQNSIVKSDLARSLGVDKPSATRWRRCPVRGAPAR
jgi:hypothetical protein